MERSLSRPRRARSWGLKAVLMLSHLLVFPNFPKHRNSNTRSRCYYNLEVAFPFDICSMLNSLLTTSRTYIVAVSPKLLFFLPWRSNHLNFGRWVKTLDSPFLLILRHDKLIFNKHYGIQNHAYYLLWPLLICRCLKTLILSFFLILFTSSLLCRFCLSDKVDFLWLIYVF